MALGGTAWKMPLPLSQTISDTDYIMRSYNQLTAAGSYGERMILNGNQYKLNLTLSLAKYKFQAWRGAAKEACK